MCVADAILFFGVIMKRFLLNSVCAMFVGLVCLSTQAKAEIAVTIGDTVTANRGGYTSGTGQVSFNVNLNGVTKYFSTSNGGLMHYTNAKVNNVAATPTTDFYTMCVDLNQFVQSANTFTVGETENAPRPITNPPGNTGMGADAANALGWLWNSTQDYGSALAGNGKALFQRVMDQTLSNTSTKNLVAGALQLATWKLVYDGKTTDKFDLNNTLGTGKVIITGGKTSAEYSLAQSFLTAIAARLLPGGGGIAGGSAYVTALLSTDQQDQLMFNANGSGNDTQPVPEPATIAIWGLVGSLGAFYGIRFNRRRLGLNAGQEILA